MIAELRAQGHEIRTADLGGGLGIRYDPAQPAPPTIADYGAMVARVTRGWDVRLIFEPGRLIVGDAGVLLTEVIRVKPGAGNPVRHPRRGDERSDAAEPLRRLARHRRGRARRGERMIADVVGPVCETGDTFAVGPGDGPGRGRRPDDHPHRRRLCRDHGQHL